MEGSDLNKKKNSQQNSKFSQMYLCYETKISTNFSKKKFCFKNSKICPENTCLLPPKIGLGMWKTGKENPNGG